MPGTAELRPGAAGPAAATPTPSPARSPLVALIGPPNSGKSTLFNRLTGLRQKVANYPGVTVEKKLGDVHLGDHRSVTLIDLPGLHGFSAKSLGSAFVATNTIVATNQRTRTLSSSLLML